MTEFDLLQLRALLGKECAQAELQERAGEYSTLIANLTGENNKMIAFSVAAGLATVAAIYFGCKAFFSKDKKVETYS